MAIALTLGAHDLLRPQDYQIPADYISLPPNYVPKQEKFVGLLACQMDPFRRTLDTRIVKIGRNVVERKDKNASKKKQVNVDADEVEWEIECEDTVIFPEGGGQPCDVGVFTLRSPVKDEYSKVNVVAAYRRKLDAVHVVKFPSSVDLYSLGWTAGAEVHMEVDWDRRTYHMQQHTGQHLLSAVFEHELKNDTVGWMLSQNDQPSYVDLQSSPSASDITYVMKRCNEIIQSARRVKVEVRLESDHERPGTLPEDYRDGVIRYVTIEDLDVNPCCGTHYPSLSFLGSVFIFPGVTNVSGPTRYRIYFAVGNAVLNHLANFHSITKSVGAALDCGASSVVERLDTMMKAKRDGLKREKVLKTEASRALAADLAASMRVVNGVSVGMLHREEESTDVEFLSTVLQAFTPPTAGEGWLVCLSSGPFVAAFGSGGCLLLAGSDEALVKKAGDQVKTKFAGRVKGGGKGRWQGKLTGNWAKGDAAIISSILETATEK